jgi:hypothetical protein
MSMTHGIGVVLDDRFYLVTGGSESLMHLRPAIAVRFGESGLDRLYRAIAVVGAIQSLADRPDVVPQRQAKEDVFLRELYGLEEHRIGRVEVKVAWAHAEGMRLACLGHDLEELDGVAGSKGETKGTHDCLSDVLGHYECVDVSLSRGEIGADA